jgi:M6 family metalloprotease-like protein
MLIPQLDSRGAACGEGPSDARIYRRPVGPVKAVMIFVDFPDAPGIAEPDAVAAHLLGNGGVFETFVDQSHGNLDLTVAVRSDLGWRRMPKDSEQFNFWSPTMEVDGHRRYLEAAAVLFKGDVNFADFDFVYVVAPEQGALPLSPAFTVFPTQGAKLGGGREITLAVTFGRDSYSNTFINLVHETGHLFGLPDLYPGGGFAEQSLAGCWCIMSDIFRASGFIGWHRHKCGWLADDRKDYVAMPGRRRVTLTPLTERAGLSLLAIAAEGAVRPSKVWVVEVAQPPFRKGGLGMSPVEGVLLYRVDAALESGKSPIVVVPKLESSSVEFGNLFQAPFQPGDPRFVDRFGERTLALTVLGKTGTAYDLEVELT